MTRAVLRASILAATLLAASPLPALSQGQTPAAVPRIAHTRYVLPNGLRLLVHEDHKAPIVTVNVWYHVGSKNEKPGKTGFAHLFEHLMFNGSEHFQDDYFKAVEPIGATDLNGTTNPDRTNYFQNVPVPALDRVLWLESDRMGHLLGAVDQAVLDEQRGVVQNEKRQGENQPYGKMWITVTENTYPSGHPYSWSTIGSMEDLNAASLEDVQEWFRTYYGAANAVLVVAGDVDPEQVKARVEHYFGDIASGPPIIKQEEWIARRSGIRRQVMQDRVPQARVVKVWNVPGIANMASVPLEMAQDILSTGRTSRLYRRLVYTDRSATTVTGFYEQGEIGGQVWIWADVQPGGDPAVVERAMDEELARFFSEGPSATELEQAKVRLRAGFVRGIERIGGFGGKSDILAQGEVYAGDPDLIPRKIERAQAATAAEIAATAREWLADGQYVLTVLPFPEYAAAQSGADRSRLPDPGAPPPVGFPAVESAKLSNGLTVQLARRTTVPVVRMQLVLDAGYAADASAAPGTANLTLAMLDEGTATRTSQQIGDELALLGAQLSAGSSLDASFVTLNALKDRLDPSLALYADVILNPAFPQGDLDRLRQQVLAQIKQEMVQPTGLALRTLPQLLYGPGHPYAMPLTGSGTEAAVQAMTRADLERFHRTWFKPNRATLLVVGDITLAELRPKLERAFASWGPGEVPAKTIGTVPLKQAAEIFILDRPGAEQTFIIGGQLIPPKSYDKDIALQAFNDAFGGAFGSRLNMNLREDKHWSYGAGTFPFDARGQRPWVVFSPVQTDKTAESLQEIVRELREVAGTRPIGAAELQEAKDRQTRTLAGRWETGGAVLGSMEEIVTYGLPADYYATFAGRVNALSTDQVKAMVAEVLRPDGQVYVLVGDRAKIEEKVKALGIGPVRLLLPGGGASLTP